MKVSDWIKSHPAQPVAVAPDETIENVAATFLAHPGLRDLYIMASDGQVLGTIRHTRLAKILLAEHLPVQSRHQIVERVSGGVARDLMDREFVYAHPEEELDNVLHRMVVYKVEDMPVLNDANGILGNINLTDVLRAMLDGELCEQGLPRGVSSI